MLFRVIFALRICTVHCVVSVPSFRQSQENRDSTWRVIGHYAACGVHLACCDIVFVFRELTKSSYIGKLKELTRIFTVAATSYAVRRNACILRYTQLNWYLLLKSCVFDSALALLHSFTLLRNAPLPISELSYRSPGSFTAVV